jgi:hypothetical protein
MEASQMADEPLKLTDEERARLDELIVSAAPRDVIKAEMCRTPAGQQLWDLYWQQIMDDDRDTVGYDIRVKTRTEHADQSQDNA